MDYFIGAVKQYATFSGRTGRKDYWMFYLFYLIFYIALVVVDNVLGTMALSFLYSLALFLPCISITTRRLHDVGRSGWWQLIALVPLIGFIVLVVFLVRDSSDDNEFGPSPMAA